MDQVRWISAALSLLLAGALFGFFYAWVCSTMWGLDSARPAVAIEAMQAMNASVRNAVFAPAFFGTGPILLLTAVLFGIAGQGRAAIIFAAAGLVCLFGAVVPTMAVNVPMNEALARVRLPLAEAEAARVWAEYSPRWQVWNTLRCIASGAGLMLTGLAIAVAAGGPLPRVAG